MTGFRVSDLTYCPSCGLSFKPRHGWEKICRTCYIEQKKGETQRLKNRIQELELWITELRKGLTLDEEGVRMLRKARMLCHPDRHDNSALSQEVTQWLNARLAERE